MLINEVASDSFFDELQTAKGGVSTHQLRLLLNREDLEDREGAWELGSEGEIILLPLLRSKRHGLQESQAPPA
jgi:hypothetical protein